MLDVVSYFDGGSDPGNSGDTGWTFVDNQATLDNDKTVVYDRDLSATGAYAFSGTFPSQPSASLGYTAVMATFKCAVGGALSFIALSRFIPHRRRDVYRTRAV